MKKIWQMASKGKKKRQQKAVARIPKTRECLAHWPCVCFGHSAAEHIWHKPNEIRKLWSFLSLSSYMMRAHLPSLSWAHHWLPRSHQISNDQIMFYPFFFFFRLIIICGWAQNCFFERLGRCARVGGGWNVNCCCVQTILLLISKRCRVSTCRFVVVFFILSFTCRFYKFWRVGVLVVCRCRYFGSLNIRQASNMYESMEYVHNNSK